MRSVFPRLRRDFADRSVEIIDVAQGDHYVGDISKKEVLEAFGAQIFFDDQAVHTNPASEVVPSARVPSSLEKPERRKKAAG